MTVEKVKVAREMYDSKDHTVQKIAETVGVSRQTIYRHLSVDEHGAKRAHPPR
jgi:DNA-binding XRE family transcriptional regulator